MKTKILFIRHGESEANQLGFWGGRVDVSLTETGKNQAEMVAKFVTENYAVDEVYSSTLQRALQTAAPISRILGKKTIEDKRLCEIYGGIFDGMKYEQIKQDYPEVFSVWNENMSKVALPNGENVFEVQKRGFEAIEEICKNNFGKTVVIVTHRVILRTIQCIWENKPLSRINECEWADNSSVSEVDYENGKLYPVIINQIGFLGNNAKKMNSIM